jgi:hypothetical protein
MAVLFLWICFLGTFGMCTICLGLARLLLSLGLMTMALEGSILLLKIVVSVSITLPAGHAIAVVISEKCALQKSGV